MTSQTLFYGGISVKLCKYNMTRIADDGNLPELPESVVLIDLHNGYPPPEKVSRFPGLMAIKRQRALEIKSHYFTDDRLEMSSLDVLSNVRSHTPTQRNVHIDWCWGNLG